MSPSGDGFVLPCTKLVVLSKSKFNGRTQMTSVRSTRSVLLVLGLILLTTMPACAQITSQTGAVRIIVVDPQGASVSDAKVTLNSPLGTTTTKETAADGSVVFPLLDPGSYKVTVERGGFRRAVVNSLAVKLTPQMPPSAKRLRAMSWGISRCLRAIFFFYSETMPEHPPPCPMQRRRAEAPR